MCSSVPNDVDVKDDESVTPYVYVGRVGLVPVEIGNDIEESSGIQISPKVFAMSCGKVELESVSRYCGHAVVTTRTVEWNQWMCSITWICRARGVGQHRIHRMPVDTDATQIIALVFMDSGRSERFSEDVGRGSEISLNI